MKKKVLALLVLLLVLMSPAVKANDMSSIDMDVTIHHDGSITVDQVWDTVLDEGTELYIPMTELGKMGLENYRVLDGDNQPFEYIEDWDINASRQEKANKYGINQVKDGFELCFGIGDYGENLYRIIYTYTDAVASYEDKDGFNLKLINPGMDPAPEKFRIEVSLEDQDLTDEIAKIWGFGYEGMVEFTDGKVVMTGDKFTKDAR